MMRVLIAFVVVSVALAGRPALAQDSIPFAPTDTSSPRFRFPPPFAEPDFPRSPVPPPDKNYWIPLGEVVFLNMAIWGVDYAVGKPYAKISFDTIADNFDKGWIVDTDDFWANQLMHPIHGSLTYTAARSMGLNFYESFGYAFLGSAMWEQFLEIQPPSMNDQVNTPFGGALVGEALFRLSRLVLDSAGYQPGGWREFFSLLIAPVAGVNRLLFGDKYRGELMLPPSWLGEFRFGAVVAGANRSSATGGAREFTVGPWASFALDLIYGIPGTPGLEMKHPFDHFTLSASLSLTSSVTAKPTATLLVRGLLLGQSIHLGEEAGGLWGLFTTYDFIAPAVFRVGGFGFGPGVSLMKRWGSFELHGTALAEALPWAGGGSTEPLGARDYHYGPGAGALIELRAHFGDRVTARLAGREYWIGGNYARGQSEDISYGKADVTVRLYGMHAISGAVDWGYRRARYEDQPDIWQRSSVFAVYYTLLQGW